MYVICQNDYPLIIVDTNEEEAEKIRIEIQNRCDEQTKKINNIKEWKYYHRQVYIHIHKLPIIEDVKDIDNKIYWPNWQQIAYIK